MVEIFNDGFESGDFIAWDGTSGTVVVVNDPYQGAKAMESQFDGDWKNYYCYTNAAVNETHVFCRWYFKTDTLPPNNNDYIVLMQCKNTGLANIFEIQLYKTGDTMYLRLSSSVGGVTAYEYEFSTGKWYCLEWEYLQDAVAGVHRLWLDGTLACEQTGLDTSGHTFYRIMLGLSSANSGACNVNHDCVVVADARIGCEAAGQQLFTLINEMNY